MKKAITLTRAYELQAIARDNWFNGAKMQVSGQKWTNLKAAKTRADNLVKRLEMK